MPIEIKELNIKISLDQSDTASANQQASNGGQSETSEQLIEIIVEKVLEILKTKAAR